MMRSSPSTALDQAVSTPNGASKSSRKGGRYEVNISIGDYIELVNMPDDPDPIPAGTRGKVRDISGSYGQTYLSVDWDNRRSLTVILPVDTVKVLVRAKP
jgi:hypothetical protein